MRIPREMIQAALRLEDSLAVGVLTGNPVMGDGNQLFSAAHGNLAADDDIAPISTASLARTLNVFRRRTGITAEAASTNSLADSSAILSLTPDVLRGPPALDGHARRYLESPFDPDAARDGIVNPFKGRMELAVLPQLDDSSLTQWYAACSPSQFDTIEVCFLSGYENP